jgi:hypothetical protein
MPEAIIDGVENSGHRLLIGDVRRERRAAPPMPGDLLHRRVGQLDVACGGHGDVEPVGRQLGGYDPPHASGASGHQRGPGAAFCGHLGCSFPLDG